MPFSISFTYFSVSLLMYFCVFCADFGSEPVLAKSSVKPLFCSVKVFSISL